jgi:hypothetical protein
VFSALTNHLLQKWEGRSGMHVYYILYT